ncbi:LLM class flavin-dependent oxidoreductase [Caballeronia sp. GAWG2-1]|uniref:LLM class flavin-dependent oxidoreductase n=1 Tax=Caballeronia sp. GAWG2-1 TaxID=2921744 RepID=UPI0020297C64|nr:LLM class flavin-dependent oxidoreductase [Caballeronia sp. GAWG2-1]
MQVALELGGHWPDHNHHIDNLFPEMLEVVKLADQVGIDAFLMGEHHFMDYNATPDPIALATHIAAMTKRQRLILAVMLLPLHDPQRLAGELAMADQLTRGRIDVGFGRGGGPYELRRFNVPSDYESAREIFEERLRAMRLLFVEKDISLDWKHTKFNDVTIVPPVFQRPYPPIWLSAQRVEAAYHIAKQGYHVQMAQLRNPMSYVKEMMNAFHEGVAVADQHQGKQNIGIIQWVYIAKDEADRREKVELAYQKHRKFMGILKDSSTVKSGRIPPVDLPGSPEDYAKNVAIGSLEYVTEHLLELKELGFDYFMMQAHCGPDHRDIMTSMETFGERVLPLLHTPEEAAVAAAG